LIIDILYRNKNIKLTISLELLFRRIANNKSMQKIIYFFNFILYNGEERKFYKYVRDVLPLIISIKNYLFKKKGKKKAPRASFQNQNRTIILSFKKAVVYIFSIKKI